MVDMIALAKELTGYPVSFLPIHPDPHVDEYYANHLLRKFGEPIFPGISKAKTVYWDRMPKGLTWLDCLKKFKTLPVGMGHSPFDEHLPNGQRVPDHCAATLVAEFLGLQDDLALENTLKAILRRDTKPGDNFLELPSWIKTAYEAGRSPEDIESVAIRFFEDLYLVGMKFAEEASPDFRNANHHTIITSQGEIRFTFGLSENDRFGKFARWKKTELVYWMNKTGRGILQTSITKPLGLAPVAQMMRCEEIRMRGGVIPSLEDLARPGVIPECPTWFYFVPDGSGKSRTEMIMTSGKGSAKESTVLSLEQIGAIVMTALHPNWSMKIAPTDSIKQVSLPVAAD